MIGDTMMSGSTRRLVGVFLLLMMTGQAMGNAFVLEARALEKEIEKMAVEKGVFSPELVMPLEHVARLHYRLGSYDLSYDALSRVQHIIHRQYGVTTPLQQPIVRQMAHVSVKQEEFLRANQLRRFELYLAERNFDESSIEMASAAIDLGDWYALTGQIDAAIDIHRRAVAITIEDAGDPAYATWRAKAYTRLANSLLLAERCCAAEAADKAASAVKSSPGVEILERRNAILTAADLHLLDAHPSEAHSRYREALALTPHDPGFTEPVLLGFSSGRDVFNTWRARTSMSSKRASSRTQVVVFLPEEEQREVKSHTLVGAPLPMCDNHIKALLYRPKDMNDYAMDFNMTVQEDGRVADLEVVDNGGVPARLAAFVRDLVRITRFRPRFEDGEPVATRNVHLRQKFGPSWYDDTSPAAERNLLVTRQSCDERNYNSLVAYR